MPHYQCDTGAIKHILSGSNIMAPGLTSPGGRMDDVEAHTVVAVMAEGKKHAMGIGGTTLSTNEIRAKNKDVAVDMFHYLNDSLYKLKID